MSGRRLLLYGRNYCHLCHDMLVALEALRDEPGVAHFEIEMVDVDADPVLESKYDELVPVLADEQGLELCHYFLDTSIVREYLAGFR